MPLNSWSAYDSDSAAYFNSYEKLRFSSVHRSFLRFLPKRGAHCLDIGAGSGRDAAAMAKRGYIVTAVEPNSALLNLARQRHALYDIRWINDHLPSLTKLRKLSDRYQFILLSAVWMHLQPDEWGRAFSALSSLVEDDGCVAISLRYGSDDLIRGMHEVDAKELVAVALKYGFRPLYVSRRTRDRLGRAKVEWKKIVLVKTSVDLEGRS